MCKKILLTARDPGAVGHLSVLYDWLKYEYEVFVISSGTAYKLLSDLGISSIKFELENGRDIIRTTQENEFLINAAKKLVYEIRPDLIVASLSSFGAGIDEAVIAVSPHNAIAIQDFWGDLNLSLGIPASKYLVMDEFAYNLTKKKSKVECLISGSIKHTLYKNFDIAKMRQSGRNLLLKDKIKKVIGWFGQNIEIPGYIDVLKSFVKSISNSLNDYSFIYRGHPKFVDTHKTEVEIFQSKGIDILDATDIETTEQWLSICDIIVTPFSLCGLDHAYLSKYANNPIGCVMYLMTNKAIRNFAKENIGCVGFPIIEDRIGNLILDPADINSSLTRLSGSHAKTNYFYASKNLGIDNTKEVVLNCVKSYIQ